VGRRIESHIIEGPAGKLEALLEEPEDGAPQEVCLICHPHPLGGGTMRNKVVHRLARGIRESGAVVLRFNFRGVGLSEGEHAQGIGEIEDARAALKWLRGRYAGLPFALAGFSFGSRVILKLGCELGEARLLLAAGMPTRRETFPFLSTCVVPKVFISSTQDEFAPQAEVEQWFAGFAEPKRLVMIAAGDHFFDGALDEFEAAVKEAWRILRSKP
jgi:alpha/beta superfamily hydrolase